MIVAFQTVSASGGQADPALLACEHRDDFNFDEDDTVEVERWLHSRAGATPKPEKDLAQLLDPFRGHDPITLVVADPSRGVAEGAIEPWRKNGRRMNIWYSRTLKRFCADTQTVRKGVVRERASRGGWSEQRPATIRFERRKIQSHLRWTWS